MPETMRLFVAIELSEELRNKLYDFESELNDPNDKISWVSSQNIHLTLKFLGDVPQTKVDLIKKEIQNVSLLCQKFYASIKGAGSFPEKGRPNVIWVGVREGCEDIVNVFNILEDRLSLLSFEKDKRKYYPHLTLGRVKYIKDITSFSQKIVLHKEDLFGKFCVNGISLIKSTLTPKGSIYEILYQSQFKK